MAAELEKTLVLIHSGGIQQLAGYGGLSGDLLRLRHVAFSGDGEPTLCGIFAEAVQEVVHVRARGFHAFFKLVLITNGTATWIRRLSRRDCGICIRAKTKSGSSSMPARKLTWTGSTGAKCRWGKSWKMPG